MLQEMKLLKGRLIGDLITGYRDLAGQECVFKSWNWKLEWFSNRKMNPGFADHTAVEVLTREKGRLWQIWLFKRWEGWVEKYMVSMCMCSTQAAWSQGSSAEVSAISRFQYTLQPHFVKLGRGWFIFAVLFFCFLRIYVFRSKHPSEVHMNLELGIQHSRRN